MKSLSILLVIGVFVIFNTNAQTTYEKQIREISKELSKEIIKSGKKRIAIVDFTDIDGITTKLGKFIAEEFNTYLPGLTKDFVIIDRSYVNRLIEENQMHRDGLTNPSHALKLGRLAGIDALVYGSVSPFGKGIKINIKILDIQSAASVGSSIGILTRTSEIKKLMNESNADESGISDDDLKSKSEAGQDKNCARTHMGDCTVKNTLANDVKIRIWDLESFKDPSIQTTHIEQVIKAKEQVRLPMNAGVRGSRTIELQVYKNLGDYIPESRQLHIEECRNTVLSIK